MTILLSIAIVILAYLAGSLCSAIIISKTFSLPDPRQEGSQNPGATNVLRLAGKKYALMVMVFDVMKGVLPVLLAKLLDLPQVAIAFTCLAAVLGHMYPVFFQFKGGKGVATAIGALLAFHFVLGVAVVATWLVVAKFSRYSSLASIVSMSAAPFYSMFFGGNVDTFPPLFLITAFILYQHRHNISRLIDRTESKINLKVPTAEKKTATKSAKPTQPKAAKAQKTTTKAPAKKTTPKKAATKKSSTKKE